MNKSLMLKFARGGGASPADSELLQLSRDGTASYLLGNALPQPEAGLYRARLSETDVAALESFLSEHDLFGLKEKYGPMHSDSGFKTLSLYQGDEKKKIKWGTFASIPEPLAKLQARLLELIQQSRQHPFQTIHASLRAVSHRIEAGHEFDIQFSLKNRGVEPVRLLTGEAQSGATIFRLYATTEEHETIPVLSFYKAAQALPAIAFAAPFTLRAGEEIERRAQSSFALEQPGIYRLYGFFETTMEVMLDDEPLALQCFVMTEPATLTVF